MIFDIEPDPDDDARVRIRIKGQTEGDDLLLACLADPSVTVVVVVEGSDERGSAD